MTSTPLFISLAVCFSVSLHVCVPLSICRSAPPSVNCGSVDRIADKITFPVSTAKRFYTHTMKPTVSWTLEQLVYTVFIRWCAVYDCDLCRSSCPMESMPVISHAGQWLNTRPGANPKLVHILTAAPVWLSQARAFQRKFFFWASLCFSMWSRDSALPPPTSRILSANPSALKGRLYLILLLLVLLFSSIWFMLLSLSLSYSDLPLGLLQH